MPIRTNRGRAAVYRRLWGWPMRSPRHLVVLVFVVAVLVTAISLIVPQLAGSGDDSRGAAAATSTTSTPGTSGGGQTVETPGGVSGSAGSTATSMPTRLPSPPQTPTSAPPAPEALDVAESWAKAWVNHPEGVTNEEWLADLRPFTTEEYLAEMATVEPANIAATKVTGPPVAKESFTSSVEVVLPTDGGELSITVIATPQGWRVAFYEQVA